MAQVASTTTGFFPTAKEGFITTTSSTTASGAATVGLNSVAGYSDGEYVTLVIEPTGGTSKQVFTGRINVAGTNVTGVTWTEGTNIVHNAGVTVVDYETATAWALYRKGLLATHNEDGTQKAGSINTASIIDANVTTAKIADGAITEAKMDLPRWFSEIGRTTLGTAGNTITVNSIPARKYLKLYVSLIPTGGTIRATMRFNNDSTTTYAERASDNGGADATGASSNSLTLDAATLANNIFIEVEIYNLAAQEKLVISHSLSANVTGAANIPARREATDKWSNTSSQISRIDIINIGAGNFAIGSEVIVLGHD